MSTLRSYSCLAAVALLTAAVSRLQGLTVAGATARMQFLLNRPMVLKGTTLAGKPFNTTAWKGKVVLVDFWATWCPPCRATVPHDEALYQRYHKKGLEIIGVSLDNGVAPLRGFLKQNPMMAWPELFETQGNGWNPLSAQYHVTAIPAQVLLDRRGVVRDIVVGYNPAAVKGDVAALIGKRPAAPSSAVAARSVLFALAAHSTYITQFVDPKVETQLNRAGWQVGHSRLSNLSWNLLRKFNAVVLCRMPPSIPGGHTPLGRMAPLLYRFMRAGGGVLLLHDESYDKVGITENRFLKPLGARIVNQEVLDPKHQWRQPNFLRYWFAWTNNITRDNPVTKGVHTLWYPELQNNGEGRLTCPIATNSDWTVLARGMASAYSYRFVAGPKGGVREAFHTAPPILVARTYGAGRMVIFASHSTFTLQSGYFPVWQGIVLSRGAEKRPSNTGRMLFNALAWLAQPSLASGELGGYDQPPRAETAASSKRHALWLASDFLQPPPAYEKQHAFQGLIGAHSTLSDGHGTVAQWARAAQAAGYNFLVFTEAFPPMTRQRWELLRQECQRASNAHFLCVPGIAYRDSNNDHWITFGFPQWPHADWLTKGGHRVENMPGLYFGNNWAPNAIVDTMHNPVGPRLRKFFGAIAVDSYRFVDGRCRRVDNARNTYLRLMGDQYNSCPIAYYDMHRPADIPAIAKAHGYVDYAWGGQLAHVANAFKQNWYAQPQHTYISQGPQLKSWWIQGAQKVPGSYERRPWRLHIDVRSPTPLRRVTIYDGTKLFRRFAAAGHRFRRVITGLHAGQNYFVLTARDVQGRRLISPTLRTSNMRQNIFMCTDMQNTIDTGVTHTRHGRWQTIFMVGNTDTGWDSMLPLVLEPQRDLMPQGLDFQENDWTGWDGPTLYTRHGNESPIARLNLAFGSGDCTILDQNFNVMLLPGSIPVATRLAVTRAAQIEFTPRIYSDNLMLVRQRIVLKRAIQPSAQPAPDLRVIGLSGSNLSFPKFAYVRANGTLVKGHRPLTDATIVDDAPIPIGGYAALYPDFYGSGAIFPLRGQMRLPGRRRWRNEPLRLHLQGASLTLGYQMAGRTLPAGTRFRQTFLVMRARFGDDHGRCFQVVRKDYGLDGPPAYQVKSRIGAVRDTRYALDLQARGGAVVVTISRAPLPNDLPVRVYGLRNRWSAVCANLPKGVALWKVDPGVLRWRPMGIYRGVGYLDVNINQHARRLFVGHPLICGQPQLFLNLVSWSKIGLTATVHNPSAKPVKTQVRINPALGSGQRLLSIPAESSMIALIPWEK